MMVIYMGIATVCSLRNRIVPLPTVPMFILGVVSLLWLQRVCFALMHTG